MNRIEELRNELKNLVAEATPMSNPKDAEMQIRKICDGSRVEKMAVVFLNARNKVIETSSFDGTVDKVAIYPREVYRKALLCDATAVIIGHNHPSNEVSPSMADVRITETLQKGLETIEVKLLDHIIVADTGESFSFVEKNMI